MSSGSTHAELLEARLTLLERRIHRLRTSLAAVMVVALAGMCLALGPAKNQAEELTVSRLTVVDEKGTARIVLGSDRPGLGRISPSTGITIHDASGAERFGVGVMDDNRVTMGFDAPQGVGNAMRDRVGIGVGSD